MKLVTSGTDRDPEVQHENGQETVFRVLNREVSIAALGALIAALEPLEEEWPVSSTAIALDTNVFLRLAGHKRSEDIVDYLVSKHEAPIVIPGQVITEFWNNQLAIVQTVAEGLKKEFDRFKKSVQAIDEEFKMFSDEIEHTLEKFQSEHDHIYSVPTVHRTRRLLESVQGKAIVPFVNRTRFQSLAEHRYRTKTPPGFMDEGHGDFFVWADFLLGLRLAISKDMGFERAAFVTNEKKVDWSRRDVAHPVLVAEAWAVSGGPFAIWSLDKLAEKISST
ncbi:MAG: PIN domain-containing protein [Rhodospirillales bacterium]|nr:PIN domain-containing protein [Rhodospirillales bacterium]